MEGRARLVGACRYGRADEAGAREEGMNGTAHRNRTCNLFLRRETLYPIELGPHYLTGVLTGSVSQNKQTTAYQINSLRAPEESLAYAPEAVGNLEINNIEVSA